MSGSLLKVAHFPRLAVVPKRRLTTTAPAQSGHGIRMHNYWGPEGIGNREVVGWGRDGREEYEDRYDHWYPAVRFRANDALVTPIREKELGDWKNLSLAEKKLLYRYSFCSTAAETEAPDPYWQLDWAIQLFMTATSILYMCLLVYYHHAVDPTNNNEYKEAMAERMVVMEKGQFLGPARYYDYEKNQWKEDGPLI